ncbi:MAG: HD domain-containing protein [Candidatus Aerophobetes bacterium]|nr:HD domain-containing protein [Candidatus Aerophobetes bacterium]
MFSRNLTEKEIKMIKLIDNFVKDKHAKCLGHDYSHVLEVTRYAIKIAQRVPYPVDPFVLICGALLHDLGRVGVPTGIMHGLRGATLAEQFLQASWEDEEANGKILRIVTRHTPTSHIPPESVEEKIVFDADTLDRFGIIGILRGIMGKIGSIKEIIEGVIAKRSRDYNSLIFEESKEIGRESYEDSLYLLRKSRESLRKRCKEVKELSLPDDCCRKSDKIK